MKKTPLTSKGWDFNYDMDEAREKFLDKIKTLSLTMGFEVLLKMMNLYPSGKTRTNIC